MANEATPPALYKYLAPDLKRAAQILRDLRIRFSQVSVLNDADEFKPPYSGFATRETNEEISRDILLRKCPTECANVYRNLPIDQADRVIRDVASSAADNFERRLQEGKLASDLYAKLDGNFGLLSLSETVTSKLMWSFYSDGGRGFIVEFDPDHVWFNNKTADNDSFRHLRQVHYCAERRPECFLTTSEDDLLYTKTHEWEFEKEWRVIRNFNDAKENKGKDIHGKDILLFEIPPAAIRTVIFGYRTTSEFEKALRDVVSANLNLKHIVFRRTVRNTVGRIEINQD
jgi:hypothetical protein